MRTFLLYLLLLASGTGSLLSQGSVLLVGGGGEEYNDWSDAPYRWLVERSPNRKIIVLHYSTTSTFFTSYFPWLSPSTVTNLAVTSSAQANDSATYRTILEHDGIFLRGGDQWHYVNLWKGTLVEKAIREVYQRGGTVGGTSAGAMILSEIVFDAQFASPAPRSTLRNPLGAGITLTDNFLALVPAALTDTHFFERGRLGRMPVMLALYRAQTGRSVTGIGIDANTALAVDNDGKGTVMGSGTVTLVGLTPESFVGLSANKPFSASRLKFDQLTEGYTINLTTGVIYPPQSAESYATVPALFPPGALIVDGSSFASDWTMTNGSLFSFSSIIRSRIDTVIIFGSGSIPSAVSALVSALNGMQKTAVPVWIRADDRWNAAVEKTISSGRAFVFAGNNPDTLGSFLHPSVPTGAAFRARLNGGAHVLALGDDALMLGDTAVTNLYQHIYGAYYGYLKRVAGIGVVSGIQCMTRVFENADYIDNRMSGVFWNGAKSNASYYIMADNGAHIVARDGQLTARGLTPVLIVDARSAGTADFPAFRDPGKLNPRQNAALTGAVLNIMKDGDVLNLETGAVSSVHRGAEPLPSAAFLEQNYPNPFNPSTSITVRLNRRAIVRLAVFDILGREIQILHSGSLGQGTHTFLFSAGNLPSGIYYYRLATPEASVARGMVLVR